MTQRHEPTGWGSMEWLVDDALQPGARLSLARMTIHAGCTSETHRHANCDEAVHVASGRVEQRIGDRLVVLGVGDSAHIPTGAAHCSRALDGKPAMLIVAYSAGQRVYQLIQ
ncbi:MAG: cupin domain-containing protein [Rhodospirillales bacterium]